MKHIFRLPVLLLVPLILLSSCIPEFHHPITKDPDINDQLVGTWAGKFEDDDKVKFTISKKDGSHYLLTPHYKKDEKNKEPKNLTIRLSRIGNRTFWNVVWESDDSSKKRYLVIYYEFVSPKKLIIRQLDDDFIIEQIKKKKLSGQVIQRKFFKEIKITAGSAELTRFFGEQVLDDLFDKKVGKFTKR